MAEPRKITIKLRPVGAKPPAAKPAGAPAAAAPEPTTPPAAEAPAAPTPPPAAPAAEAPAPPATTAEAPSAAPTPVPAAEGTPAAQAAKRQTSRIELPPEIASQPMNAGDEPTIKLKPVENTPAAPDAQATKSKTARIALDSVLGGIQTNTPLANTTQKTIKLKRPSVATARKPAASAPMSPVADGGEEKTIKIKRPTTLSLKKDAPATPAEPELETLEPLSENDLAPLPEVHFGPAQESKGARIFTVIAVVAACLAIIATLVLCGVLQMQAAPVAGEPATGNTLWSLPFNRLF